MKIWQFLWNVPCRVHWSTAWAFAQFAEWKCSRVGVALICESFCKISCKTLTAEAQLQAFTIFIAIRKNIGHPYLPRAMCLNGLKFLPITKGQCWVMYVLSRIFCNRRRGVSKFVNCKELHFKRKANCGSQCKILTDCIGSYCKLLVLVSYSDFISQAQGGNINGFPWYKYIYKIQLTRLMLASFN